MWKCAERLTQESLTKLELGLNENIFAILQGYGLYNMAQYFYNRFAKLFESEDNFVSEFFDEDHFKPITTLLNNPGYKILSGPMEVEFMLQERSCNRRIKTSRHKIALWCKVPIPKWTDKASKH